MKSTDTRLVVEIPESLHKRMRLSTAEQNMTIKNFIILAIEKMLREKEEL